MHLAGPQYAKDTPRPTQTVQEQPPKSVATRMSATIHLDKGREMYLYTAVDDQSPRARILSIVAPLAELEDAAPSRRESQETSSVEIPVI